MVNGSKLIQLQLGDNGKNRKNSWDLSPINSREGGEVVGQKKKELGDSSIKPIQPQRFKIQAHSTPEIQESSPFNSSF